MVVTILSFSYRRTRKTKRILQGKNEQAHQQKKELETLNQVKDHLFSIIIRDLRNPLVTLYSYLSLSDDVTLSPDKKELFKSTMQAVSQACEMLDNLLVRADLPIKDTRASITAIDMGDCVQDVVNNSPGTGDKNIRVNIDLFPATALGDYTIPDHRPDKYHDPGD